MIPISLVEEPVNLDEYKLVEATGKDYILFLGFIIKNEYDNRRLNLAEKYKPIKILHIDTKNERTTKAIPLYGIVLTPNNSIKNVIKVICDQQKMSKMTLPIYKNILSQHNFSCENTYSIFDNNVYPIDFVNLKSVCTDEFNDDKKIFQHLLSINEKQFDFQSFASLKLLILNL